MWSRQSSGTRPAGPVSAGPRGATSVAPAPVRARPSPGRSPRTRTPPARRTGPPGARSRGSAPSRAGRGGVAAPDVAALGAPPQVHPPAARLVALHAPDPLGGVAVLDAVRRHAATLPTSGRRHEGLAKVVGSTVARLPRVLERPLRDRDEATATRPPALPCLRHELTPGRVVVEVGDRRPPAVVLPPPAVANARQSRDPRTAHRIWPNHAVVSAPSGAHHPSAHTKV